MTPDKLAALVEAASPLPWRVEARRKPHLRDALREYVYMNIQNVAAVSAVMNAAPALLALWRAASEVIDDLDNTAGANAYGFSMAPLRAALAALEASDER